jgi:hypothetical protein
MRNSLVSGTILLLLASVALAETTPVPTTTPTPRPRLTGGFGRAAATPVLTEGGNGQSLADVVRAASETKQKASVAITNDTLVTDSRGGKVPTASPRNLAPATPARRVQTSAPSPLTAATKVATPEPSSSATGGTEAEWRERARSARQHVEEMKAAVYQIEGEVAKLERDFYRWDDGQYRDRVIKPNWDKKKEELDAARKELAQAERDLADLPEQARKAGAFPGWIRE